MILVVGRNVIADQSVGGQQVRVTAVDVHEPNFAIEVGWPAVAAKNHMRTVCADRERAVETTVIGQPGQVCAIDVDCVDFRAGEGVKPGGKKELSRCRIKGDAPQ
ncbi:MAG: hypothetical protein ABI866_01690 [Dokdonella sp.]